MVTNISQVNPSLEINELIDRICESERSSTRAQIQSQYSSVFNNIISWNNSFVRLTTASSVDELNRE